VRGALDALRVLMGEFIARRHRARKRLDEYA
jgi:hypothetical protein